MPRTPRATSAASTPWNQGPSTLGVSGHADGLGKPPVFSTSPKIVKNYNMHITETPFLGSAGNEVTNGQSGKPLPVGWVVHLLSFFPSHPMCHVDRHEQLCFAIDLRSLKHNELHSFLVGDIRCRAIACRSNVDSLDGFGACMGLATLSLLLAADAASGTLPPMQLGLLRGLSVGSAAAGLWGAAHATTSIPRLRKSLALSLGEGLEWRSPLPECLPLRPPRPCPRYVAMNTE